jgi:hypothetical protein
MICDECETVAHCLKNGCVPKQPSKDEALKLALDALEEVRYYGRDQTERDYDARTAAITAIKQALSDATHLADAALDRMAENARELGLMPLRGGDYEPVQQSRSDVEPVAWVVEDEHGERLEWAGDAHSCHGLPTLPLYTAAQRQWVGLSKFEMTRICKELYDVPISLAFAIEAKLKEKNSD